MGALTADSLTRAARHHGPSGCKYAKLRDRLNDADRATLDAWMAANRDEIPGAWIARALNSEGHAINEQAVNRHRRGDCDCGTS